MCWSGVADITFYSHVDSATQAKSIVFILVSSFPHFILPINKSLSAFSKSILTLLSLPDPIATILF